MGNSGSSENMAVVPSSGYDRYGLRKGEILVKTINMINQGNG